MHVRVLLINIAYGGVTKNAMFRGNRGDKLPGNFPVPLYLQIDVRDSRGFANFATETT